MLSITKEKRVGSASFEKNAYGRSGYGKHRTFFWPKKGTIDASLDNNQSWFVKQKQRVYSKPICVDGKTLKSRGNRVDGNLIYLENGMENGREYFDMVVVEIVFTRQMKQNMVKRFAKFCWKTLFDLLKNRQWYKIW